MRGRGQWASRKATRSRPSLGRVRAQELGGGLRYRLLPAPPTRAAGSVLILVRHGRLTGSTETIEPLPWAREGATPGPEGWSDPEIPVVVNRWRGPATGVPLEIDQVSPGGAVAARTARLDSGRHRPLQRSTAWTERMAIMGNSQTPVMSALAPIQHQLTSRRLGLHQDRDSEFSDRHRQGSCRPAGIPLSRLLARERQRSGGAQELPLTIGSAPASVSTPGPSAGTGLPLLQPPAALQQLFPARAEAGGPGVGAQPGRLPPGPANHRAPAGAARCPSDTGKDPIAGRPIAHRQAGHPEAPDRPDRWPPCPPRLLSSPAS